MDIALILIIILISIVIGIIIGAGYTLLRIWLTERKAKKQWKEDKGVFKVKGTINIKKNGKQKKHKQGEEEGEQEVSI